MDDVWRITAFTVATAVGATALMLPPGVLLALLLARGRFRGRILLETAVSLPLVMPPVATGLMLLLLFAPRGPIGSLLMSLGMEVVFTWRAVDAMKRSRRPSGRRRRASLPRSRCRSQLPQSLPAPSWALRVRLANSAQRS